MSDNFSNEIYIHKFIKAQKPLLKGFCMFAQHGHVLMGESPQHALTVGSA